MKRTLVFVFLLLSTIANAGIVSLAGGANHTCAVDDNGALFCWGRNQSGQLGLGDGAVRYKPARVPLAEGEKAVSVGAGLDHTCALFKGGHVKCWGMNTYGSLGMGVNFPQIGSGFNQEVGQLPTLDFGKNAKAKKLSVGHYHACALLENDAVKCWGYNNVGALGIGDARNRGTLPDDMGENLPAVDLGKGRHAVDLWSGFSHNCVLLDNGAVKCWGDYRGIAAGKTSSVGVAAADMGDNLKALNLGSTAAVKHLALGTYHTCAFFDDSKVKCFGQNSGGVLGIGKVVNDIVGDSDAEMGTTLAYLSFSSTAKPTAIFSGGLHACALLDDESLKCWGTNSQGQLGLGDVTSRGASLDHMGDKLPAVNLKAKPTSLAHGHNHTCAIVDNGKVKCWGYNGYGQLGNGTVTTLGTQPSHMGDALKTLVFE